jgi:hypothetical protein
MVSARAVTIRPMIAPMCQGPGVQRYVSANILIGSQAPDWKSRSISGKNYVNGFPVNGQGQLEVLRDMY